MLESSCEQRKARESHCAGDGRIVEYRSLDLIDIASIDTFAADLGPVDVLINNAGESQSGPLEDLPTRSSDSSG